MKNLTLFIVFLVLYCYKSYSQDDIQTQLEIDILEGHFKDNITRLKPTSKIFDEINGIQFNKDKTKDIKFDRSPIGLKSLTDSIYKYIWNKTSNKWDSLNKFIYFYDNKIGTRDSAVGYIWQSLTNKWRENTKSISIRDSKSKLIEEIIQTYSSVSIWKNSSKYNYIYDTYGNVKEETDYTWDTSNKWIESSKYTYKNDVNGKVLQKIYYKWNKTSNNWIESTKKESIYDNAGYVLEEIDFVWTTFGTWLATVRNVIKYYDLKGNILELLNYKWNQTTNTWSPALMVIFSYDASGKNTGFIRSKWDITKNAWALDYQKKISYDANSKPIEITYDQRNSIDSTWVLDQKYNYAYDLKGRIIEYIEYFRFQLAIFLHNRRVYKYDSDDNVIEEVWYNKSLAGWDESTRWVYYFSKHEVSSVDLLPDFNKYTLYPNPAHEFLNVKNLQNEDIQIYDLSGKLMISKKYNADNTLDISVLNKGVYIITITDKNNNTVSKKFVKQ